jgi:hypothetical protein
MPTHLSFRHPAELDEEALLAQCETNRLRRSGPGGQHRNKVETAVQLLHQPTGIQAEANERRSQAENRGVALFRLRLNLALELRVKIDASYAPSPLWQSRCRQLRLEIRETHTDFPTLLAELLDVLAAVGGDPAVAAERLATTPSQLVKLLKKEPRAFALVNVWRGDRGLHRLQ